MVFTKHSFLMLTGCALMFTACGGGDEKPSDGGGGGNTEPTTLTVSGKVMDSNGKPLANASVLVSGKAVVTSDATGAFSVADVTAPYDIIAVNGGKQSAIVYKGVTRKNPLLSIPWEDPSTEPTQRYTAKVTGKITGFQTPSDTVDEPVATFVPASDANTSFSFDASTSSYAADLDWGAAPSISGSLIVLQTNRSESGPSAAKFLGFGRRDNVTLTNGATLASQDVALTAVTTSMVTGSVTVPEGLGLTFKGSAMELSSDISVPLDFSFSIPPGDEDKAFNYSVPAVPQSTFTVLAGAIGGEESKASAVGLKRGLAAGATNVTLDLKPVPSLQQPADQASNASRTTEFSWTSSMQGGVNRVVISKKLADTQFPQAAAEQPFSITVVTSESRATLPDLSALGMALPASTDFTWTAQSVGPAISVDALLVGASSAFPLGSYSFPEGKNEVYFSLSAPRAFKTAAAP